jgi:hypothetical protein
MDCREFLRHSPGIRGPAPRKNKEEGVSWLGGSPIKKATTMPANKKKRHRTGGMGWLRAAVLGANDGILSTSSRIGSFRAPLFKGRHPLPE